MARESSFETAIVVLEIRIQYSGDYGGLSTLGQKWMLSEKILADEER